MPDAVVLLAVGAATALGWLPLLHRFVTAWLRRGQLMNLAMTGLVMFAMYVPTYLALTLLPSWPIAAIATIDALLCVFCLHIMRRTRKTKRGATAAD